MYVCMYAKNLKASNSTLGKLYINKATTYNNIYIKYYINTYIDQYIYVCSTNLENYIQITANYSIYHPKILYSENFAKNSLYPRNTTT